MPLALLSAAAKSGVKLDVAQPTHSENEPKNGQSAPVSDNSGARYGGQPAIAVAAIRGSWIRETMVRRLGGIIRVTRLWPSPSSGSI